MADVSWVQIVVGAVTVVGTALKLPAAKVDWAEEHRTTARIERYKKVLDAADHPSVTRELRDEIRWNAMNLLAQIRLPYRARLRVAVLLTTVGFLASTALIVLNLVFDWGWGYFMIWIIALLVIYFASYPILNRFLLHQANRRAYVLSGAPAEFRIANRAMIPTTDRRTRRKNIYVEFDSQLDAVTGKSLSLEEAAPEVYRIWTGLLDKQQAEYREIGKVLRGRLDVVNAEHPNPTRYAALDARLRRTEERLRPPNHGQEADADRAPGSPDA